MKILSIKIRKLDKGYALELFEPNNLLEPVREKYMSDSDELADYFLKMSQRIKSWIEPGQIIQKK